MCAVSIIDSRLGPCYYEQPSVLALWLKSVEKVGVFVPCTHNPCTITCNLARPLIDWLKCLVDVLGDVAMTAAVLLGGAAISALSSVCTT